MESNEAARADGLQEPINVRLAALAHELEAGNRTALARFWQEVHGQAPLVEPVRGDDRHYRLTFLWRGDDRTRRVALIGGFPAAALAKPLERLGRTDLWYRTETHPAEARFSYSFLVNGPETLPWGVREFISILAQNPSQPDPLNAREYDGESYVELPGAPPQPWIHRQPGVPQGQLIEQKFRSQILDAEYPLTIYKPPGDEETQPRCWLMIAFDGGFPTMEVTLDNLLAAGKIPPLVVVGVHNISTETRNRDLTGSDAFAHFLASELVPWARGAFRVYGTPSHTIVGGVSYGGLMAAYCGLKHSQVFGKVLSQSGSFWQAIGQEGQNPVWTEEAPGMLARQFAASPRVPVEFYLEVGRYETYLSFSLLAETRRLRDVLEAKGYRVAYAEYVGGHNYVRWRGSFADALIALTAAQGPAEAASPGGNFPSAS